MIPTNKNGESLPVLTPKTTEGIFVDGLLAHAESPKLAEGIYRFAVHSSTDDTGCNIVITDSGTSATVSTGFIMKDGSVEYFGLEEGSIVSVINGKINIVPFS